MRNTSWRRSIVVTAVAAALGVAAVPASAATTYTARIGTTASGSGTYTAASSGSVVQTNASTGVNVTCTSVALSGAVPALGSGLTGSNLLTGTASSWTACTGFGISWTVTQKSSWSYGTTAATTSAGVTKLAITGISLAISGPGCGYSVTGSTDATYTNSTRVLAVSPVTGSGHVLTVSAATGCFGLYNVGNTWSFVGNFTVAAKNGSGASGSLAITSP